MSLARYRWWVSFSPKNLGSAQPKSSFATVALTCIMAGVLAIPAVERVVGVAARYAVPTVLVYVPWVLLSQRYLCARAQRVAWAFHLLNAGDILLGQTIAVALPIASGDPTSPLWTFAVIFAALDGADYDYGGNYAMLALHTLTPLLGAPFYLAGGVELGPALGGPLFFAACSFLVYHYNATRQLEVRAALAERDELRQKLGEERALRERERIADDLHDTVGAALAEAALWHSIGRKGNGNGNDAEQALERAERRLKDAILELRLAVQGLSSGEVSVHQARSFLEMRLGGLCEAAGVNLAVHIEGARIIPVEQAQQALKLVEEAVVNAVKHGKPRSVSVEVQWDEPIRLTITDDGDGFDPEIVTMGNGLSSMKKRAQALGRGLVVESARGKGTSVSID